MIMISAHAYIMSDCSTLYKPYAKGGKITILKNMNYSRMQTFVCATLALCLTEKHKHHLSMFLSSTDEESLHRDHGLSFREICYCIGCSYATVMSIWNQWMQEGTTNT